MKFRGLIVAAVVLAGLTATLYWSNHRKPEPEKVSADTSPKILSLAQADVTRLDLHKKGGDELVLSKDKDGKWQITAPKPLRADQSQVTTMLSSLSSLSSDRLVEDKASNLNQFGLAQPAAELVVSEKGNKTHTLLIGDDTPTSSGAYAMVEGDPRVFTIPSYTKNDLVKNVNELRDKHLLTVNADKISQVELIANKQDIEFGRNKDEWQIVKPRPLRADSIKVDDLVQKLTNATMELGPADEEAKQTASAFAAGTPVATAKITDESGTQELQLRKDKNDYYAKSSAVDGVYKVASSLGTDLNKNLDDFRNKALFDFGYTDPNKIEVHDGAKSYFLTKSGNDWWSGNGKKWDPDTAQTLVDKLRDLMAAKFVANGFTAPVIELTVTSNDGKKVEKVELAKAGNDYIAKRDSDSALYQLDSSAVQGLQKAAADLKPAATVSK